MWQPTFLLSLVVPKEEKKREKKKRDDKLGQIWSKFIRIWKFETLMRETEWRVSNTKNKENNKVEVWNSNAKRKRLNWIKYEIINMVD